MILQNKTLLITGILTDKSIAYASAKIAIENGATVVATGFGKGLRITERAVKRLSEDIKVFPMDIENQEEVDEAVQNIKSEVGNLDGILHAIAFHLQKLWGVIF
jgi:enoyl-[acyl-carrier protein] reductase I